MRRRMRDGMNGVVRMRRRMRTRTGRAYACANGQLFGCVSLFALPGDRSVLYIELNEASNRVINISTSLSSISRQPLTSRLGRHHRIRRMRRRISIASRTGATDLRQRVMKGAVLGLMKPRKISSGRNPPMQRPLPISAILFFKLTKYGWCRVWFQVVKSTRECEKQ